MNKHHMVMSHIYVMTTSQHRMDWWELFTCYICILYMLYYTDTKEEREVCGPVSLDNR